MAEIYILIMVVGFNAYSGGTTVQREFMSKESCEEAKIDILKQLNQHSRAYINVRQSGCYKK